jgi:hypothetical protein
MYKKYLSAGRTLDCCTDLRIPFSPDWYVSGSVLKPGRFGSIVEVTRFQLHRFTVSLKDLAEWFGLEVARVGGRMFGSATELNGQVPPTLPRP